MRRRILLALIVAVLLTGCGEPAIPPTPTAMPTAFVSREPAVNIFTPTVIHTGCNASTAATMRHYALSDVERALAPLGASDFRLTPRDPQSQAPNTTVDQRSFVIPSVAPQGGQVLFFGCAEDVAGMQAWYARSPDLAPYVYAKGNVVLQLNSGVPKAEAEKYRAALERRP